MEINETTRGKVACVAVNGRLTADCAESFKKSLSDITDRNKFLVLDLSKLEYIDSTGLGAVVFILQKNCDNGGDMKLACLQGTPRIVFDITKAYKIFDIFDTVDAAVEAVEANL